MSVRGVGSDYLSKLLGMVGSMETIAPVESRRERDVFLSKADAHAKYRHTSTKKVRQAHTHTHKLSHTHAHTRYLGNPMAVQKRSLISQGLQNRLKTTY